MSSTAANMLKVFFLYLLVAEGMALLCMMMTKF